MYNYEHDIEVILDYFNYDFCSFFPQFSKKNVTEFPIGMYYILHLDRFLTSLWFVSICSQCVSEIKDGRQSILYSISDSRVSGKTALVGNFQQFCLNCQNFFCNMIIKFFEVSVTSVFNDPNAFHKLKIYVYVHHTRTRLICVFK